MAEFPLANNHFNVRAAKPVNLSATEKLR